MKLALTILITLAGVAFIALLVVVLWFWAGLAWLKAHLDHALAQGGARWI